MFSPFLQEVGIAPSFGHDLGNGLRGKLDSSLVRGFDNREFGLAICQWPDLWKVKKPLRVGLCFACPSDQLRKPGAYDDLRVHYAVNCASIGCPMLREEAYVADRLEAQLEEQAVRFLSDHSRNRFEAGKLEVSKIFDWFKEDFGAREQYFAKYAKLLADAPDAQKAVAEGRAPLSFLDYDWSLNDPARDAKK